MKPLIDLEEAPGKVVGKVPKRTPGEFLERMAAQFKAMGLSPPYPKGVYRFKMFEEANEWQMKHQIAAAAKCLRELQR